MELSVYKITGEDTGRKVALNDAIFGIEPNDHAIYLDVKQFLANQRQGTHKSKERSEISGSTRKLGRQKGGGGARRGDINSPVLVGGARVFGPKPRDYWFKLNKKVKALARKSALTYKAQENALVVVEAGLAIASALNTYSVLNADSLVVTESALKSIEATLNK